MANSLYKFCSSVSHLPEILSGRLRFTPPIELNDPSELLPRFDFDEVRSSLSDLRLRGHSPEEMEGLKRQGALMEKLCPELPRAPTPQSRAEANAYISLPVFDDVELLYSTFSMMTRLISERVGVCCLTRKFSSLPMWSHYANRAHGYVVEYSDLGDTLRGDETTLLDCVREVKYSREFSGVSFYPDSYDRIFFTKFKDWEYEEEYRIVGSLAECEISDGNGPSIYTKTIPKRHISSITLGWMLSEEDRDLARREVRKAFGNSLPTFQAHLDRGEVKTQLLPQTG